MCKNNSRDSRFFGVCSMRQICNDLISDSHAVGYYSYTKRCTQAFFCNTNL